MKSRTNQKGVAALEGLLILIVVGLIGFVGWRVMSAKNAINQSSDQAESQQLANPKSTTAQVNSAADLNTAQKSLDAENPDDNSADLSQMDKELSNL